MAKIDTIPTPAHRSVAPESRLHSFHAIAFVENFSLKELAGIFPGARFTPHELQLPLDSDGDLFAYPFGAVVFHDLSAAERGAQLGRLRAAYPKLTAETVREDFAVREEPGARTQLVEGTLVLDHFTRERASAVSLVVAQSAAMEYYERILLELVIAVTGRP